MTDQSTLSHSRSFLRSTGQYWKYDLFDQWPSRVGFVLAAVALWESSGGILAIATLVACVGMILAVVTIRCPYCRAPIYWFAVRELGVETISRWLLELTACPRCGRDGEGQRDASQSRIAARVGYRPLTVVASTAGGVISANLVAILVGVFGLWIADLTVTRELLSQLVRPIFGAVGCFAGSVVGALVAARLRGSSVATSCLLACIIVVEVAVLCYAHHVPGRYVPWLGGAVAIVGVATGAAINVRASRSQAR
jgi:hypothetical protein